jgi:hypothetical protein
MEGVAADLGVEALRQCGTLDAELRHQVAHRLSFETEVASLFDHPLLSGEPLEVALEGARPVCGLETPLALSAPPAG